MSIDYELSLWRDIPATQGIREEKIAIIATTNMDFAGRAQNIKLKREFSGKITLTFELPVKYFDVFEGKEKTNPLISQIYSQSKIKLWRDEYWWNPFAEYIGMDEITGCKKYKGAWTQGRWYDFIVTTYNEKRTKKKLLYSYTCDSLFIKELSRTGYDLELVPDTDVMSANGMGTAHELAKRIVADTEWEYIKTEIFPDYKEEFNPYTGETVKTPVATDQIEFVPGLERYVYCYNWKPNNLNEIEKISNEIGKEQCGIDEDTGNFWWRQTPNGDKKHYIYGYNKTDIVTNFANKLICYTSGEMVKDDKNTENSYVNEATLLSSNTLWNVYEGTGTINSILENNYNKGIRTALYRLEMNSLGNKKTFYNNSINNIPLERGKNYVINLALADDYDGQIYFEIYDKINSGENSEPVISEIISPNYEDNCFNNSYYLTIPTRISEPYIALTFKGTILLKGFFIYELIGANELIDSTIKEILSTKQLYMNSFSEDEELRTALNTIGLTEIDINKNIAYYQGSETPIWLPVGTMVQNNFENGVDVYLIETLKNGEYIQNYINLNNDDNFNKITSYKADKRRAISGKKTNRYSLLETINKTFFCFTKFIIEHDEDGRIKVDNLGRQKKYFTFTSELGRNQFQGFTYGINLEGIERKIDSTGLVTKVYVSPVENQYDKSGLITIQNSTYNKLGETFLYNFNYYMRQNFFKNETFLTDYVNLIDYVSLKNSSLLQLNEDYIAKKNLRDTLKTSVDTNLLLIKANTEEANNELVFLNWDNFWKYQLNVTELETKYRYPYINWQEIGINDLSTFSKNMSTILTYLNEQSNSIVGALDPTTIEISLQGIMGLQTDYHNRNSSYNEEKTKIIQYDEDINNIEQARAQLIKEKNNKIRYFEQKYHNYILEGEWSGTDYIEADTYYLDATRAMSVSCMPRVSYTANALDLSKICNPYNPEDKKWGESFVYDVGDISYIKDEELFGTLEQKAMVASIESFIDVNKPDNIELRNFETRFEELFQSIAATVTDLQLNSNIYGRAANFEPNGIIETSILQKSFNENKDLVISSSNNQIIQDNYGLTIKDNNGTGEILRAVAGGIFLSKDNGQTFTAGLTAKGINASVITSGQIDTSKIVIRNSDVSEYVFDSQGITAYRDKARKTANDIIEKSVQRFVRFDQFGIWMTDKGSYFPKNWWVGKTNLTNIIETNSIFSLTENGLQINSQGNQGGTIKISTQDSTIYDYDNKNKLRIKLGYIRTEEGEKIHGLDIYDGCFRVYGTTYQNVTEKNAMPSLWFEKDTLKLSGIFDRSYIKEYTDFFQDDSGVIPKVVLNNNIKMAEFNEQINLFYGQTAQGIGLNFYDKWEIYKPSATGPLVLQDSIIDKLFIGKMILNEYKDHTGTTSLSTIQESSYGIGQLGEGYFNLFSQGATLGKIRIITNSIKKEAGYNNTAHTLIEQTSGQISSSISLEANGVEREIASIILYSNDGGETLDGTIIKGSSIRLTSDYVLINGIIHASLSTSSDKNLKNSIQTLSQKYSILFDNLTPVIYKYNNGTSNRYHTGFIAQEVKSALDIAKIDTQDFAGLVIQNPGEKNEIWALRYEEFIALNTSEIQKLKKRITELERIVTSLTSF